MAFTLCPFSVNFPVCCPVTYQVGLFEGYGTVWNLSLNGLAVLRHSASASGGGVLPHGDVTTVPACVRGCWPRPMGARRGLWRRNPRDG